MSIHALQLEVRWDLRQRTQSESPGLPKSLVAAIRGSSHAPNPVQLALDRFTLRLQSGPFELRETEIGIGLDALIRWSREVDRNLPQPSTHPATTHLFFFMSGLRPDWAMLRAVTELMAPSLLLLLGRPAGGRLRLRLESDVIHVSIPYLLNPSAARLTIPIMTGMLTALLRDGGRGIWPRSLIRHPDLVVAASRSLSLPQRRKAEEPVLTDGRETRLSGVTADGRLVKVYAQQSLTVLYLYAEPDVQRLLPARLRSRVRRAVTGETGLSLENSHAEMGKGALAALAAMRASGDDGRSDVVTRSTLARHLILAVIQTGPEPVPADVWTARAMARQFSVEVVLCPWYGLEFCDRAVYITGPVRRVTPTGVDPALIPRTQAREVDMLFFVGASGGELAGTYPAERNALQKLASLGVQTDNVSRYFLVDRLMAEASRRCVVTNAIGPRLWGPKHELELRLRSYSRGTGRRLSRPETLIAERAQLPTVLKSFARRGIDCIVKPAFGAWGAGSQALRPDSPWQPISDAKQFVVQQLVPRPVLLGSRKIDLRCHVLIDVDSRERCKLIAPVLVRRAGTTYVRGDDDAEINNLTYQRQRGLHSSILPIDQMIGIPEPTRRAIMRGLETLAADLVDAYFFWARSIRASHPEWIVPRRVLVWGIDVGISRSRQGIALLLLENNTRPQLLRNAASCDRAMAAMLLSNYLPSAVRCRLDSVHLRQS
ncbi:MAG TPA: hypothetical protein VHK65_13405 [Candidatus Dormibacteraeota bacterium]|nr:hypothetical protein [Candidatus Dormibacteraeota bacterium]